MNEELKYHNLLDAALVHYIREPGFKKAVHSGEISIDDICIGFYISSTRNKYSESKEKHPDCAYLDAAKEFDISESRAQEIYTRFNSIDRV